jgi:hypothetical protein
MNQYVKKEAVVSEKYSAHALWILQPILFVCGVCLLFTNPDFVLSKVPNVLINYDTQLTDLIPEFSNNRSVNWRLGQLSLNPTEDALKEASLLANWDISNASDFVKYGELLELSANKESYLNKILNFVTFVNTMWVISIVIITVTIGPFLYILAQPIAKVLYECVKVLFDLIVMLKPLYEPLAYVLLYLLVVQGGHYPKSYGQYVSLLGALGFVPLYAYSNITHSAKTGLGLYPDTKFVIYNLFLMAVFVPLALFFQSSLYGFLSVGSFYGALGFSAISTGLCYVVGFDGKDSIHRCLSASMLLVPFYFYNRDNALLQPFLTPVYVMGVTVYLLGLLIVSSGIYAHKKESYFSSQIMMIASLCASMYVGSVYSVPSMYNTGVVFAVLYLMDKFAEAPMWRGSEIIPIFFTGVAMYFEALYLHTHPEMIVGLFKP